MRNTAKLVLATVLLASTALPVHAEGLLSGIVDDSNALVTINQGTASDSGLVNIGLGGGDGNVVDLGVGGGAPLASANVGTGNGLGVSANVGGNLANASADLGGSEGLLDANVDLLNGPTGGGLNVGVTVGSTSGAGTPGAPSSPGVPGAVLNPSIQTGSNDNSTMPSCDRGTANDVAQLIRNTRANASWAQASGVKVQRVDVCPELEIWLAAQLQGSALGDSVRAAVRSDPLLNASLSRTSYGPDRVFAINRQGSQLVLYVY